MFNGSSPSRPGTLDWQTESSDLVDQIFGVSGDRWKLHIVNLRNVAHDLLPMVLGVLLELLAFEMFQRGQGATHPTLLVLEEAHHYLRQISTSDEGARQMLAYERLAKEGRKFGISLWVSTQRPAEVSPTVLAQCGTWVVFRLTSEHDLRAVGAAGEWLDRQELDRIAGLPTPAGGRFWKQRRHARACSRAGRISRAEINRSRFFSMGQSGTSHYRSYRIDTRFNDSRGG